MSELPARAPAVRRERDGIFRVSGFGFRRAVMAQDPLSVLATGTIYQ